MESKSAFTIVELVVVVSIITTFASIAAFGFTSVQKNSRDSTRKGNVTVITEGLEKYYDKNGEYPPVVSLVNNSGVTAQTVATKLGITVGDLKMPRKTAGTNPLTSTDPPTSDNIAYVASSVIPAENTLCQSDASKGCDRFTIKYIIENGSTIVVESRRRDRHSNP